MDLVDIARAFFRFWYAVVAILVVGGLLALAIASTVQASYDLESEVLFVGPQSTPVVAEDLTEDTAVPNNPWLQFSGSMEVTSEAVARIVDGTEFRGDAAADGMTGTFAFEGSSSAPLITTIATGDSPEEVRAVMDRVTLGLEATLTELQSDAGVPLDDQITMRILTISDPMKLIGARNRVLVGIMGVTVVAAIAVATLLESRRLRRPSSNVDGPDGDQIIAWGSEVLSGSASAPAVTGADGLVDHERDELSTR
jgi:hypothetical protein